METTAALAVRFGGQSGPRDVKLVTRSVRSTCHPSARHFLPLGQPDNPRTRLAAERLPSLARRE